MKTDFILKCKDKYYGIKKGKEIEFSDSIPLFHMIL